MIDKATKHAYFSDVTGNVIIDFQFSPHELEFRENSKIVGESVVGHFGNNLLWIGGDVSDVKIHIFIDRTEESFVGQKSDLTTRHIQTPGIFSNPLEKSVVVDAIKNVISMSQLPGINNPERSYYDPAPHFPQKENSETGVLNDIAKFQYFTRPEGYKSNTIVIKEGSKSSKRDRYVYTSENDALFSAPPIIRFYHGEMWVEGYITNFSYKVSAMNTELIPRRMEGDISIKVHRYGSFKTVVFTQEMFNSFII